MRVITMKLVHKFVWALMVSLALLLSGCGGSSGGDAALSAEDQARMERAETQTAALKAAYDAAMEALSTLEDDTSDATQAEIDAVEEKLTALKAAVAAAADVSDEVKAMYSAQTIETRLAAGKKNARLALEAEVAEQAKMARAETQTAALKMAHDEAVAALATLEDDTSDATQAEVDAAQAKLEALKAAIVAAADVSAEVKAMYPAEALETRLATAKESGSAALMAAAAKAERVETQTAALKAAYDAAVAALATLNDDTDDATQAEIDDVQAKLEALKAAIAAAADVSAEVKAMYPADMIETDFAAAKKVAKYSLEVERLKMTAGEAIEGAGEAIEGAGEAIAGAGEAIEGAGEAIEGAETAVEGVGIIRIQTGSGAGMVTRDVEAARTAYEAAKSAYETAKSAYETAKSAYETAKQKHDMDRDGADTLEKVNALKVAADAAKTAADAAKTAADAAKTAAETAKTEAETAKTETETDIETVRMGSLGYVDGAYRVGDLSINPAATGERKRSLTRDGKTTTIGYIESIDSMSKEVPGRDYVAASGGDAEKPGQVKIWPRDLAVGSVYDSNDDKVRLRLINHYIDKKSVYGFRASTASSRSGLATTRSEETPYGTATDGGKKFPIMKATDEFYRTFGGPGNPITAIDRRPSGALNFKGSYDAGNINKVSIVHNITAHKNIYYYEADDGTRYYFNLSASNTVASTGVVTFTYSPIEVTKVENFPDRKAYAHMNYGIWAMLDEDGDSPEELGIGFVRRLTENSITSDLPSGNATYNGHWVANIRAANTDGKGAITEHDGEAVVTAEFSGDRKVKVDLKTLAMLEGTITSGTSEFKGTKVTDVLALDGSGLTASANGGDTPDFTATMSGAFFGPMAAEVGGIFNVMSEGMKKGEFRGAFGGVKQPAEESSE